MADKNYENHDRHGGYTSEFSEADQTERKRYWRDDKLSGIKRKTNSTSRLPSKRSVIQEYDREEGKVHRFHMLSLDAYSRHKVYINNYLKYYGGSIDDFKRDSSRDKSDHDILAEQHRFVWTEDDQADDSWEKRLAKKYYDKLFKEYCIADLSCYKINKVALRWRIEKEVLAGKGQFICGNKKCDVTSGLQSWEVNFAYLEHGEKKNALVKLRLCPECSMKLNYHHRRKPVKRDTKQKVKHKKSKRRKISEEGGTSSNNKCDVSGTGSSTHQSRAIESNEEKTLTESDVWSKPATTVMEKTREEEFDDYFVDMFL